MPKLPLVNQGPAVLKSAFITQWLVEPQSDDRPPMFGAVGSQHGFGTGEPVDCPAETPGDVQGMVKEPA